MPSQNELRASIGTLVAEGQLVGKQLLVLKELIECGPGTSGEILRNIPGADNVNAWRARFTELQGRGLIREVGQRKCKITGRLGIVWAPTGREDPLEYERSPPGDPKKQLRAWRRLAYRMAEALTLGGGDQFANKGLLDEYRTLTRVTR